MTSTAQQPADPDGTPAGTGTSNGRGGSRTPAAPDSRVVLARNAVAVVFVLNGLAIASWFARIPAAKESLDLPAGRLGLVLLAMSSGAVLAMLTAGAVTSRFGTGPVVVRATALLAAGLVVTGLGAGVFGSVAMVAVGLFAIGSGSGTCDVAMNVEAAVVERRLGWTVMPRFHAGWSIGTVAGAAIGAGTSRLGVPIEVHLALIAALTLVGTVVAVRSFLTARAAAETAAATAVGMGGAERAGAPGDAGGAERLGDAGRAGATVDAAEAGTTRNAGTAADARADDGRGAAGTASADGTGRRAGGADAGDNGSAGSGPGAEKPFGVLAAWTEPRTLLLGLLVLVVAFTEGTANDWLAVGFVDGYGLGEAGGAAVFGVFVAAMTAGRTVGTVALDRWGRVPVLVTTMLLAVAGSTLAVLAGSLPLAVAGAALWGLGASLGFPVGMSAAADDESRATARVSVVAVLGYTAFLAGPPVVGFLGDNVGVLRALLVVPLLLIPALALVPVTRPPAPTSPADR